MKAMNCKGQSDEQLVSLLQLGDKSAMAELYKRYHTVVFHKCLSFSKNTDDASDMTQDIMLKVINKVNTFNGLSKFSTWLYSITFNHCIDLTRKNKKESFQSLNNMIDIFHYTEQDVFVSSHNEIRTDIVDQVLSLISKEDQNLLLMKYQCNKSIAELQSTYKLSASAVKMRLLRARTKAAECYSKLIPSHAA